MSRFSTILCLTALSLSSAYADAPASLEDFSLPTDFVIENSLAPINMEPVAPPPVAQPKPKPAKAPETPFTPFTGKIKGRNVRVRLQPDLESRIVKELSKNDLVSVVGSTEEFWVVEPPSGTKTYVFRSFVLDDVVEGNRVNVRLEPSLEAPVVAHLNAGDKVKGVISAVNNKWMEIAPPEQTHFYIAKDYIEYAGGPEAKAQFDKRHQAVEQLLDSTSLLGKAELRKSFDDIDFDRVAKGYQTIINDYAEFPEYIEQAREALTAFQENYLEKRITYLENHPQGKTVVAKEATHSSATIEPATDKMKMWETMENALYISWANVHENGNQQQFYEDQKLVAQVISGIVEPYNFPVVDKPGDFLIRGDRDTPVGYAYSTTVNLQNLVGQKVTLTVASRPNNNFAFPAYFVLSAK